MNTASQVYKQIPMYKFLLILSIFGTASHHAWHTLFNNFSVEKVLLGSDGVGLLQSVREIPGFLSLLAVYVLLVIKEHYLASISVIFLGIGVALTGFFPSMEGMIYTTLLMSFGFHYFETVNQSLSLQYFSLKDSPFVLADLKRFGGLASIFTGAVIWLVGKWAGFENLYLGFGLLAFGAGIWSLFFNPESEHLPPQHKKMVFRKKYWLFYTLQFLSGARRQVFIVFAVFLMVQKFGYSTSWIAGLFALNQLINFFLYRFIAILINRFGERPVLIGEYAGLILIFLAYTIVDEVWIVGALYILDNIFFNSSIGIRTYFQKIADPKDIAPTAGVSFTINHIAAVIIPILGGLLWLQDFRIPFYLGAFLGLLSLILCFFIPKDLTSNVKTGS